MTREEAIKELSVEYFGDSEKIREAKRMAIAALKAEQAIDEEMSDRFSMTKLEAYKRLTGVIDSSFYQMKKARMIGAMALKAEPYEDAVSREAVLSALSELPHEYKTKEQRARTGGIAACQVIVRELPPVTPKPRWISVSERLPEEDKTVLVTLGSTIYKAEFISHRDCWFVDGNYGIFCAKRSDIVAWMPLPEPYKEASK